MFHCLKLVKFPLFFIAFSQLWTGYFLVYNFKNIPADTEKLVFSSAAMVLFYSAIAVFTKLYENLYYLKIDGKNTAVTTSLFNPGVAVFWVLFLCMLGLLLLELVGLLCVVLGCALIFLGFLQVVYRGRFWFLFPVSAGIICLIGLFIGAVLVREPFANGTGTIIFSVAATSLFTFLVALINSFGSTGKGWKYIFGAVLAGGLIFLAILSVLPVQEKSFIIILTFGAVVIWYLCGLKFLYIEKDLRAIEKVGTGMGMLLNAVILYGTAPTSAIPLSAMLLCLLILLYEVSAFLVDAKR